MLKLHEFVEGCHNVDVCSGEYTHILEGKRWPNLDNKVRKEGRKCPQSGQPEWSDGYDCQDHCEYVTTGATTIFHITITTLCVMNVGLETSPG